MKQIKTSYNAGELSPYMDGREDVNKYHSGCSKLINAIVLPHGGITKRSGTEFMGKSPNKQKLIPFEFSVDDSLMLEFSNLLLRFYKDDDRVYETAVTITSTTEDNPVEVLTAVVHGYTTGEWVLIEGVGTATSLNNKIYKITVIDNDEFSLQDTEGNNIDGTGIGVGAGGTVKRVYQIVSPYTSAQAYQVHYTQSADVMYFAHEDVHPKKLSRISATSWTIVDVDFKGGPFLAENTDNADTLKLTGGTHTAAQHATIMTDSTQSFVVDSLIGYTLYNVTDSSTGTITDNDATTITVDALVNGVDNDFDTNDVYIIIKNGYYIPGGCGIKMTLTATGHTPFLGTANDVGTKWLLKHARADNSTTTFAKDTNVIPTSTAFSSGAVKTKGDFTVTFEPIATGSEARLWRKQGNGAWQEYRSFRAATSYSGTEDEDDVYYAMTRSAVAIGGTFTAKDAVHRGVVEVTAQSSTTVATVEITEDVYFVGGEDTLDNETSMWAEGAWGLYRGYPRTVAFYEDRLWWASSTNNPDTLWSSKSGDYENMEYSDLALDDDAIVAPLNDSEVSQIQWMMARQLMAVGAANKEYRFGASNPDDPITPSDRKAIPQTGFGSGDIQPVILNDTIFFFQRQGKKLGAMKFDTVTENFNINDATLFAYGLFDSAPVSMAVQRVPDSLIWVTRADGVLLSFSYNPEEEIAGWARHITQNSAGVETPVGFFECAAVKHGSTEDEVWVSVRRIIGTTTMYYTERFATRLYDELDEAMLLDSAVIVVSAYDAKNIILASDTVRCGSGLCNSSLCGGVTA